MANTEWTIDAVSILMEDDKPRTALEISIELGRPRKTVQRALSNLSATGMGQSIHVCGKLGQTLVYVNGPGVNVAQAKRRSNRTGKLLKDAGSWWPVADSVVVRAMRAMVAGLSGKGQLRASADSLAHNPISHNVMED